MSRAPKVRPVPDGYHTITPTLTCRDAAGAIDFYRRAFDAEIINVMRMPDGKVMHAELAIGNSRLFLGEEQPQLGSPSPLTLGGTGSALHLYVKDVDQAFERALQAGAAVRRPLQDQFWGDRYGVLSDKFGNRWALATHKEDVPEPEMKKRMEAAMAQMAKK